MRINKQIIWQKKRKYFNIKTIFLVIFSNEKQIYVDNYKNIHSIKGTAEPNISLSHKIKQKQHKITKKQNNN